MGGEHVDIGTYGAIVVIAATLAALVAMITWPAMVLAIAGVVATLSAVFVIFTSQSAIHDILAAVLVIGGLGLVGMSAGVRLLAEILRAAKGDAADRPPPA